MSTAIHQKSETFSIADAQRHIVDLLKPNPAIYWCDFLVTWCLGIFAHDCARRLSGQLWFSAEGLAPEGGWTVPTTLLEFESYNAKLIAYIMCATIGILLFYRAAMFIHEIVHFKRGSMPLFRFTWNALCGITFLIPSFVYYTHLDHHRRVHYGTDGDGEYLPLARRSPLHIILFMLHPFIVPPLVFMRFLVFTPLAYIIPGFRRWIHKRASSMIIDPTYIRPAAGKRVVQIIYMQEFLTFLWCIALIVVPIMKFDIIAYPFLLHAYVVGAGILTLNGLRTLGAHRWTNDNGEMTFEEQLLDSVNYPHNPILGELWAPVGLRYHALHHFFPKIPYHNLPKAHRRLMENLPDDSPYRNTSQTTLRRQLADLWSMARNSARTDASDQAKKEIDS